MGHEGSPVQGGKLLPRKSPVSGVIPLQAEDPHINGKFRTISSLPGSSVLFNPDESTYTVFVHSAKPLLTAHTPDLLLPAEPDRPRRIALDEESEDALVSGLRVHLSPQEFVLLKLLMNEDGKTVDFSTFKTSLWPDSSANYVNSKILISQLVHSLRQKVEVDPAEPQHIKSVRGLGYLFRDKNTVSPNGSDNIPDILIHCGGFLLDRERHELVKGEERSKLTDIEYELMKLLVFNRGKFVNRNKFLDVLKKTGGTGDAFRGHIKNLRKKLKGTGTHLVTVRGEGHILTDEESSK